MGYLDYKYKGGAQQHYVPGACCYACCRPLENRGYVVMDSRFFCASKCSKRHPLSVRNQLSAQATGSDVRNKVTFGGGTTV